MKIRPLNDWAVIVPAEAEVRTAGGLFIPDAAKEKPAEGIVEAIGPGALEEEKWEDRKKEKGRKKERKFIPTSVKPGERVMYERFAGQTITAGGEERVLVREKSILGILPPAPVRPKQEVPPLLLPAATASPSGTALARRETGPAAVAERLFTSGTGPAGKKAKGKAATKKKPVNKTAKKAAAKPKKASQKKAAAKKAKKKR